MNKTTPVLLLILLSVIHLSCEKNSKSALTHYKKGNALYIKRDFNGAKEAFNKALKEDSSLVNASVMLAKIAYFNKKYSAALSSLNEVLDKDPNHAGALYWKARTLVISAQKDRSTAEKEALTCLLSLMEVDSSHLNGRLLLALVYERNGKYKEAIYQYKRVLMEQETLVNAQANLAVLYHRIGLKDKSKEEITQALSVARASKIPSDKLEIIQKEMKK